MKNIHVVENFDQLANLLLEYKNANYAFVSYISGEYGMMINMYKTAVHDFYQKMKQQNIKTVAFVLKNSKCFAHDVCDEIIEFQDVNFDNVEHSTDLPKCYQNMHIVMDNNSYCGNDGWALQYIRGTSSQTYESIIDTMNFTNLFFTLHVDGSYYINRINVKQENESICLYKIQSNNFYIDSIKSCINHCRSTTMINNKNNNINKSKNIAIWIRNTNKWCTRNMKPSTYNTIFRYCIEKHIKCHIFLDLIPVEIPDNQYLIDCTNRLKNRPNWDEFINILTNCDFYIGSDSGSSELVLLSLNINCLFDANIRNMSNLNNVMIEKRRNGLICKTINFESELYNILDTYYNL